DPATAARDVTAVSGDDAPAAARDDPAAARDGVARACHRARRAAAPGCAAVARARSARRCVSICGALLLTRATAREHGDAQQEKSRIHGRTSTSPQTLVLSRCGARDKSKLTAMG